MMLIELVVEGWRIVGEGLETARIAIEAGIEEEEVVVVLIETVVVVVCLMAAERIVAVWLERRIGWTFATVCSW